MAGRRNNLPPVNPTHTWPALAAGDKPAETLEGDPLYLHNSDHPGITLVTTPLSGNNYLSWNRAMLLALRAKNKLGFINGKIAEPALESPQYENWKKVDCMVISWILNSLSKDIVDAFMYIDSAKQLWDEITERFGESNGPLIYQLEKEIFNITQGNMSVTIYYTKLKKLWDELCCLSPLPSCTCGASKALNDRETRQRLMQFLMGLNDTFDHIRSQILIMDPLPTINKAYSLVIRVEKHRNVQISCPDPMENAAMMSRVSHYGKDTSVKAGNFNHSGYKNKGPHRRLTKEEKAKLTCDHCQGTGHDIGKCFKLHGYPDWWDKLKQQRTQSGVANMVETESDPGKKGTHETDGKGNNTTTDMSKDYSAGNLQIFLPINPWEATTSESNYNFVHFVDFGGTSLQQPIHYSLTMLENMDNDSWILDTGASRHMCSNLKLLTHIQPLSPPVLICLPDGTTKTVHHIGLRRSSRPTRPLAYLQDFVTNVIAAYTPLQGASPTSLPHTYPYLEKSGVYLPKTPTQPNWSGHFMSIFMNWVELGFGPLTYIDNSLKLLVKLLTFGMLNSAILDAYDLLNHVLGDHVQIQITEPLFHVHQHSPDSSLLLPRAYKARHHKLTS
ncbi:hypothetical protein DH2020_001739 [Rehmannia glutinosa]|uniref:Retrotransposon Copia-like N-terminal domain-containing protein n=1 Tax=Rehmannia glutinosa TaxID=99300 RepID=A0ABR0XRR3_REHGL